MSRDNIGDIEPVGPDEDVDPDVLIAEREIVVPVRKSARQILEDMKEEWQFS